MESIIQNGWDQLVDQHIDLVALTLLYYDYVLTLAPEFRLFWSQANLKQWGSILFFLNRYCGIIGHIPVFIILFARPGTALHLACKPLYTYHQMLAMVMESIVALTFITRTYALYNKNRLVLVGMVSACIAGIALSAFMISGGTKLDHDPALPEGLTGCSVGLSRSQSWHIGVIWGGLFVFDVVVVGMTLAKTIQINRRSGRGHSLTHILMRDGVVYFGIIGLVTLSNILSFVFGTELTRGVSTTMTNVLSSVLVSRLMFNLREQKFNRYNDPSFSSDLSTFSDEITATAQFDRDLAIHETLDPHEAATEMVQVIDRTNRRVQFEV